jgi:hypothetical protein
MFCYSIHGKCAYYDGVKTMYYCQVLKLLLVGVYQIYLLPRKYCNLFITLLLRYVIWSI